MKHGVLTELQICTNIKNNILFYTCCMQDVLLNHEKHYYSMWYVSDSQDRHNFLAAKKKTATHVGM